MSSVKFNFRETVEKFFVPLRKYPIRTAISSVLVAIALYVGIDILIAELVRQNTYDIHMLASEMIIELGPDLAYESGQHAEMIKQYNKHLEQRQLAGILRVLYPKYSPEKALASSLSGLEKAAKGKEEEAKKAIWQAGLASHRLYRLGKRFPQSPYKWFESEGLPDWLLIDLDNALDDSSKMVYKLEKEKTPEVAVESCRANRRAILLIFLARLSYDNEEKIKHFLSDVEKARDCTISLARKEKDKKKQEWLYEVAKSEDRRVQILEAMLANKIDRVCDLLREAIETAFEKEKADATE